MSDPTFMKLLRSSPIEKTNADFLKAVRASPVESKPVNDRVMAEAEDIGTADVQESKTSTTTKPVRIMRAHTPGGDIDFDETGRIYNSPQPDAMAASRSDFLSLLTSFTSRAGLNLAPALAGTASSIAAGGSGEAYDKGRDPMWSSTQRAQDEHPMAGFAGSMVPMVAGAPQGIVANVLLGTGEAAVQGFNASPETLRHGNTAQLARDTLRSGAFGAGGGLMGGLMGKLGPAIQTRRMGVIADKTAEEAAKVQKEIARLEGLANSEVQQSSRLGENVQRFAGGLEPTPGPSPLDPELQKRALEALSSEDARALFNHVGGNSIERLPGQLTDTKRAQAVFRAAQLNGPAEAGKRTAEYFAAPFMSKEVWPRVERTATRGGINALVGVLAGAGGQSFFNGHNTAGAGLMASALATAAAPGTVQMVRNFASSPRTQELALRGASSATGLTGSLATPASVVLGQATQANAPPPPAGAPIFNSMVDDVKTPVKGATKLAMQKLAEYLGVAPKSKEEMATQHSVLSVTSPEYQARDGGAE